MKETCDVCGVREWERIKFGKFTCGICEPDWDGYPAVKETVILMKGEQGEEKSSKTEVEEIRRNILIPNKDGHNYACRIGENGKIQEKHIKV